MRDVVGDGGRNSPSVEAEAEAEAEEAEAEEMMATAVGGAADGGGGGGTTTFGRSSKAYLFGKNGKFSKKIEEGLGLEAEFRSTIIRIEFRKLQTQNNSENEKSLGHKTIQNIRNKKKSGKVRELPKRKTIPKLNFFFTGA